MRWEVSIPSTVVPRLSGGVLSRIQPSRTSKGAGAGCILRGKKVSIFGILEEGGVIEHEPAGDGRTSGALFFLPWEEPILSDMTGDRITGDRVLHLEEGASWFLGVFCRLHLRKTFVRLKKERNARFAKEKCS